jgi:hypothetical protein
MRRLQGLSALVDDLLGHRAGLDQGQAAVEIALGEFRLGPRIRKLAVRLGCHRLERTRIDHVQEVAGLDEGAVSEFDAVDEAADPGANLNFFHRLEPPGELIPIGHRTLGRLRHRDRRRARGRRRRLIAAARQNEGKQNDQRPEVAEWAASENNSLN